eukprot:scaffold179_cov368-Prasinococcus_capsulatus_cf.AAC.5
MSHPSRRAPVPALCVRLAVGRAWRRAPARATSARAREEASARAEPRFGGHASPWTPPCTPAGPWAATARRGAWAAAAQAGKAGRRGGKFPWT